MVLGDVGTWVVLGFGVMTCAVVVAGFIWILRNVLRDPELSLTAKTIWIVVLIGAPILGILAWFVFQFRSSWSLPHAK